MDADKLSVGIAGFVGRLICNKTRGCCVVCCREKKEMSEGGRACYVVN